MYGNFGKSERRHHQQRQWKRGRRRTRQDQISLGLKIAGETADLKIRTERRKLVSSAGPVFEKSEPSRKYDPAV
jgi:hypothetical protein